MNAQEELPAPPKGKRRLSPAAEAERRELVLNLCDSGLTTRQITETINAQGIQGNVAAVYNIVKSRSHIRAREKKHQAKLLKPTPRPPTPRTHIDVAPTHPLERHIAAIREVMKAQGFAEVTLVIEATGEVHTKCILVESFNLNGAHT